MPKLLDRSERDIVRWLRDLRDSRIVRMTLLKMQGHLGEFDEIVMSDLELAGDLEISADGMESLGKIQGLSVIGAVENLRLAAEIYKRRSTTGLSLETTIRNIRNNRDKVAG